MIDVDSFVTYTMAGVFD